MIKTCKYPECGKDFEAKRSKVAYCSRTSSNLDRQRTSMTGVKEFNVISCGGGVQSTAMIALVYSGKLPKPDLVLMVDTGYEKQGTLEYARKVLIPACEKVGVEFKFLKTPDNSLHNNQGMVFIPAWKRLENGGTQKLTNICSGTWKVVVMRRYLRSLGIKKARSWIGISTDEAKRQRASHQDWLQNYYPLIEKDISRYQCLFLIRSIGWPDPPRSSCIMCPMQHDDEYEVIKSLYPEDYQRIVEMDNEIERVNPNIFIHKSLTRMRDIIWQSDVMGGLAFIPAVPCEICL